MARCLIIGCGCRGRMLATSLVEQGHSVRGTTRDPSRRRPIEATGAEAVVGDPDRVGTLIPALAHVSVAVILLGSASGPEASLAALHGSRLQMLLSRMTDTTIRGVVYEGRGSVSRSVLRAGGELVAQFGRRAPARTLLLEADPAVPQAWLAQARAAVEEVLRVR